MIEKVYIETYGCQMNRLDSSIISNLLNDSGFTIVLSKEEADLILLNTCAVREHAEQRVLGRIGELKALLKLNDCLRFGVIGCMAQRLGERLFGNGVSLVVGPDHYRRLPELINNLNSQNNALSSRILQVLPDEKELYDNIRPSVNGKASSFVAISRGCDNFCSYCIVPYTRGRLRHINSESIIEQVESLVGKGVQEVTLLGQNVNAYGDGAITFEKLLRLVADVMGLRRLRFLTSHPKDLSVGILEAMADGESICEHLHLPVQSGSDRILGLMNRKYTVTEYLTIVEKARELMPGISITTDFIFGFPGESEEDFEESLNLMRRVRFDSAYLYKHSPREGTKAFTFDGNIPEEEKIRRLSVAIELQQEISARKNESLVGESFEVMIDGLNKYGRPYGMTATAKPVIVESTIPLQDGQFITAHIKKATAASLIGIAS